MPRFSRVQRQALGRITQLAASGLHPDALAAGILDALDQAMPADGWVLYGVDPDSLLYNRVLAERSTLPESRALIVHYLTESYLVHEPTSLAPPGLMRMAIPVTLFRDRIEASRGIPPEPIDERTENEWANFFYEDVGAPPGGTVSAHFAAGGRWIAALDALRLEARSPFRPIDAAFLRYLSPRIGAALGAALNRERAMQTSPSVSGGSGVLVIAPSGNVQLCTPAAEAWMARMRDQWLPQAPGRMQLPIAVWSAVARFRSGPSPTSASSLVVATSAGPLLVEATAGGEDGSIAVVLTPLQRPTATRLPESWALTAAERAVVIRVMRGMSNRDVANELCLSEHTVEFHLSNLYSKLGIRGRSELLSRLFHELYWPDFQFPIRDDQ